MLSIRQRVICGVVPNDSVEATARSLGNQGFEGMVATNTTDTSSQNPESQAQKNR